MLAAITLRFSVIVCFGAYDKVEMNHGAKKACVLRGG